MLASPTGDVPAVAVTGSFPEAETFALAGRLLFLLALGLGLIVGYDAFLAWLRGDYRRGP